MTKNLADIRRVPPFAKGVRRISSRKGFASKSKSPRPPLKKRDVLAFFSRLAKAKFFGPELFLVILFLLAAPAAIHAQNKKGGATGVIRLEETVVEGRVAKPNAFFINTRQAMVYETMVIRESFVREIPKAVQTGPF